MEPTWTYGGRAPTRKCGSECNMPNRDQLIVAMRRYLDSMLAHDATALQVTANVKVIENGEPIELGTGLFETATDIGFQQYFADSTSQQVGFFGTLQTSAGPRILALRLAFEDDSICEVEAIVAREGGHVLFAPQALVEPLPIYDQALTDQQRMSSQDLVRCANRYFDAIEQADGRVAPCHAACNRRENGVQTTNNPARKFPLGCREGIDRLTYIPCVRERRFPIVDETRGLVWGLVMFDMPSQHRSMRLAELFKIAGGEICEIEAVLINTPLGAATGWDL